MPVVVLVFVLGCLSCVGQGSVAVLGSWAVFPFSPLGWPSKSVRRVPSGLRAVCLLCVLIGPLGVLGLAGLLCLSVWLLGGEGLARLGWLALGLCLMCPRNLCWGVSLLWCVALPQGLGLL